MRFMSSSAGELTALESVAEGMGKVAHVAVRVNPDVDAHTHPYITTGTHANKFGVAPRQVLDMIRLTARSPHLHPIGLHVHIGSQLSNRASYRGGRRARARLYGIRLPRRA